MVGGIIIYCIIIMYVCDGPIRLLARLLPPATSALDNLQANRKKWDALTKEGK